MGVQLKVMQTKSVMIEITPGVQGLPCLHTSTQGKPCTPASLLIVPDSWLFCEERDVRTHNRTGLLR